MLVLSRKIGEVITVGSSVQVTVLSYDRGVVRLGIEAPKTIPVHRKEVHDKIVEMNKKAALTKVSALKDAISKSSVLFDKIKLNGVIKSNIETADIEKSNKENTIKNEDIKNKNNSSTKEIPKNKINSEDKSTKFSKFKVNKNKIQNKVQKTQK